MTSFIQANTNGRLHDASLPSLSPLNRGFLYGDAIYEVWRTYQGVIFAWEDHWRRLERSAAALHLPLAVTRESIFGEIQKTATEYRRTSPAAKELYIRLQITRGSGPIGLDIQLAVNPDFVLLVQANKLYSEEKFKAGLRLSMAREFFRNPPGALNPAWKTGNYLNNILCLREARARGADEVVITNMRHEITEAAVSNIAFVRGGEVLTPPLDSGILGGITRDILVNAVAPAAGIGVRERALKTEDFASCEECFLLSTTKDVTPVASIDDWKFTTGENNVTLRLKKAFADYVTGYVAQHPQLRLF